MQNYAAKIRQYYRRLELDKKTTSLNLKKTITLLEQGIKKNGEKQKPQILLFLYSACLLIFILL